METTYILNAEGEPEQVKDCLVWGKWLGENKDKQNVGRNRIEGILVSTIFLGLDHSFGQKDPILWETMIFGGEHNQFQERYTSRASALIGHTKAILKVLKERNLI